MVTRKFALILAVFLVVACPSANSFESLRGPIFSNSSDFKVDLAVTVDGKAQQLLRTFPAHQLFAMPRELRVQSISVVVGTRHYEFSEQEYSKQSNGLPQKRQLWVFDGERVCVLKAEQLRTDGSPRCQTP